MFISFLILIHSAWKDWCRAKVICQQMRNTEFLLTFTWNESIFPFVSTFLSSFQGHRDGPARTSGPINFVVLRFFDVLPSRHLLRLLLNPSNTWSFYFFAPSWSCFSRRRRPALPKQVVMRPSLHFQDVLPHAHPHPNHSRDGDPRIPRPIPSSFQFKKWVVDTDHRWHTCRKVKGSMPESPGVFRQQPYLASEQQMSGS